MPTKMVNENKNLMLGANIPVVVGDNPRILEYKDQVS